jgi:predicted Zn-dependent protease
MYDDKAEMEGVGPAALALIAGILLVGGAIGLFLLLGGKPGAKDEGAEPAVEQPRDREDATASDDAPSPAKCADPDACLEPAVELVDRYGDPTSCDWFELHICIVPLGDVPRDLVDHLVAYYEAEYGLRISVLRPVTLPAGMDSERPGQVEADQLREFFFTEYFVYDQSEEAILIGLTAIDIYTEERPEWRWFFGGTYGFAGQDRPRQAIISSYRMDPVSWGEPADDEVRNQRVRTMMNKYVAMTYYGLQLNDDPRSVLYRQISSLSDLDHIDERIPLER